MSSALACNTQHAKWSLWYNTTPVIDNAQRKNGELCCTCARRGGSFLHYGSRRSANNQVEGLKSHIKIHSRVLNHSKSIIFIRTCARARVEIRRWLKQGGGSSALLVPCGRPARPQRPSVAARYIHVYVYIYIYIYVCMYVYIYIYI